MGVVLAGAEPLLMLGEREQGSQSERAVRLLGLRRTGPAQAKSLLLSYTKAGASLVLIETAAEDEDREPRSASSRRLLTHASRTLPGCPRRAVLSLPLQQPPLEQGELFGLGPVPAAAVISPLSLADIRRVAR